MRDRKPEMADGGADRAGARRTVRPGLGRFATVAAGQFLSLIGSALTQLVLSLWMYARTGRVTDFAVVTAVSLLPGILVGPVAGAIADRYSRRTVMLLSDATAGLATAAMVALMTTGGLQVWHVYALCALTSVTAAFQRPAYLAAVAQLVPKAFLGQANGITQLGVGAGALFAPMIGASLLAVLPTPTILLVDAASFGVGMLTLLLVRFPDRLFRRREEPLREQLVKGWRYVALRPGLVATLRFFIVDHLIYTAGFALVVPVVLIEHGIGTVGLVLSAGGLGALVGSLAMALWGGTRRRTNGMIVFMGFNALALGLVSLTDRPWLAITAMFLMSATESIIDGHWIAMIQTKVGLELQGRVLAVFITSITVMMPIGYLLIGPLADRAFRPLLRPGGPLAASVGRVFGTGEGRGLALVIVLSAVLLFGWSVRAWFHRPLRFLEDELPDAIPSAEIEDRDTEQSRADERLRAAAGAAATGRGHRVPGDEHRAAKVRPGRGEANSGLDRDRIGNTP